MPNPSAARPKLSIIIPTRNAIPRLQACLTALVPGLVNGLVLEAIVVDGGSSDHSADVARDMGCRLIEVPSADAGRGRQLALGAQAARGQWLLFLHGDTILSPDWVGAVADHIATCPDQAGYCTLAFDTRHGAAARVAFFANLRANWLALPYGDQGLLIARKLYDELGGYRPLPLMEDVDLVRRIGKARLAALPCVAQTSAAKYQKGGWWAVPLRNMFLLCAYLLGMRPETLARMYR